MTVAAARLPPQPPRDAPAALPTPIAELVERHARRWRRTPDDRLQLGERVGLLRQWRACRRARKLIDHLAARIESAPDDEVERGPWREALRERIQRFGERHLDWPPSYRRLLFADAFFEATTDFVRRARRFDPELRGDDLSQALRNVWIANSLQMLLGLEVKLTPSVFAYSMIYPLSDNFLDDPSVGRAAKRSFNERLERRLAGGSVTVAGGAEASVHRLIEMIESEHPRDRRPQVFESLMAIHRAQGRSLLQQDGGLDAAALLAITIEKGGASVLADGCLVAGELTADEADFCFGYGVVLQLLDDLQDAADDREAGHATVFSTAPVREPLDRYAGRLFGYMHAVLEDGRRFAAPRHEPVKDLIRRNCIWLLVGAVAEAAPRFGRRFRRSLQRRWPLRLAALRALRRRVERRMRRVRRKLEARHGTDSLLDLLDLPAGAGPAVNEGPPEQMARKRPPGVAPPAVGDHARKRAVRTLTSS